jgi:hypothetical protein
VLWEFFLCVVLVHQVAIRCVRRTITPGQGLGLPWTIDNDGHHRSGSIFAVRISSTRTGLHG